MIFDLFKKATITTASELETVLRSGSESISGVSVTSGTALQFAPVFSAIRVIAESIGQLPLNLIETKDKTTSKAVGHKLQRLLNSAPNSFQTSQEWREMMVSHLCLRGNFYCHITRYGNEVRELIPIQPDAVKVTQDEQFNIVYDVKFANGTRDIIPAKDMFHVKLMSINGLTGLSIIGQAREAIGLGMATEKYGSLLFKNGARPGGILSTEQPLKADQITSIRENWEMVNGGSDNAHKAAILQGGLKWTSIGMDAEDAQFLETRKYQRSEIAGVFRVPPHMIGDLERATFSNIEQQGMDFVTYSLMPWITRIEQRINTSLVARSDQGRLSAKFNVSALLRGDMAARAAFYTSQLQNGAISPNEIRLLEDMNPREGGDIYLTPLNMAINGQNPNVDNSNANKK